MVDSEVSMSSKRYTDEFKIEAVRQVTDRGFDLLPLDPEATPLTWGCRSIVASLSTEEILLRSVAK